MSIQVCLIFPVSLINLFVFDASWRRLRYSLWKIQATKLLSIARSEDMVAMFQYQTFAFSLTAYITIPTDRKVPRESIIKQIKSTALYFLKFKITYVFSAFNLNYDYRLRYSYSLFIYKKPLKKC